MMVFILIAALATFAICHFRAPIAHKLGIVDKPDGIRKVHSGNVPLVGGLSVVLPFAALVSIFLFVSGDREIAAGLVWLSITLWMLGCIDDRSSVRPILRLLMAGFILLPLMYSEPVFVVSNLWFSNGYVLDLKWFAIPFTLVSYLALQNAANMSDGMNGVLGTILLIWSSFLAAKVGSASALFLPCIALVVSISIALFFNVRGKLFFGDNGSYSLSVVVSAMTVAAYNEAAGSLYVENVILLFLIPVLDATRLIIVRTMNGGSPFKGDRNHLHHLLQRRFKWHESLVIYAGLVGLPTVLAELSFPVIPMIVGTVFAYAAVLTFCSRSEFDVHSEASRQKA